MTAPAEAAQSAAPAQGGTQAALVRPAPPDFDTAVRQHHRTSIPSWTRMILQAVPKGEWVLVADDLSPLSRSVGRFLDQLASTFTLIGALRRLEKAHEPHFWRFERVVLDPLSRAEARSLIRQGSVGLQVEDAQLLETRLLQQGAGNPRALLEIVDRLRQEPAVTPDAVRELVHTGARRQIDLTPTVVVIMVIPVAARFVARGLGDNEAYILAGVGTAVIMGLQYFLFRMRR